jgi:hypothetical protein
MARTAAPAALTHASDGRSHHGTTRPTVAGSARNAASACQIDGGRPVTRLHIIGNRGHAPSHDRGGAAGGRGTRLESILLAEEAIMPERETLERAARDKREGKAASTQAGEFVREEIHHVREGKHGARSARQAIAIGLSKARRAGVDLPAPRKGTASTRTRQQAARDSAKGRRKRAKRPSVRRSRATKKALDREGGSAASKTALAKQARSAARRRSAASRSRQAKRAARTRARH